MPARLSHVVVLTDDLESHSRFLVDVVGMVAADDFTIAEAQMADVFGWEGVGTTRARMHGEGPGSVELVEIPEQLRGEVPSSIGFLTFLTRDATSAAQKASTVGLDAKGPVAAPNPAGGEIHCTFVPFAGTSVELVQVVDP
jgi:hypothetical protein